MSLDGCHNLVHLSTSISESSKGSLQGEHGASEALGTVLPENHLVSRLVDTTIPDLLEIFETVEEPEVCLHIHTFDKLLVDYCLAAFLG